MKKVTFNFADLNIGVDVEEIGRFEGRDILADKTFLGRVFTKNELKYCFSKKNKAEHLAGRFSAKESIFKALSGLSAPVIKFSDIDIVNDKKGMPQASLLGNNFKHYDVKVSISHSKGMVFSAAIATIKNVKR